MAHAFVVDGGGCAVETLQSELESVVGKIFVWIKKGRE